MFVFGIIMLFCSLAIVIAATDSSISSPPPITKNVNMECQFYSYSQNSLIGNLCFDIDNPSYNCTTNAQSVHISSHSSSIPFLNRNYYGSACDFQVPLNLQHSPTENSISVKGYCDNILSNPNPNNQGTPNYFRFYCDPEPTSTLQPIFVGLVIFVLIIIIILLVINKKKRS